MGLLKKENSQPAVPESQYFTEVGLPNGEYLNRQEEITQEKYTALCNALRQADAIYCPFSLRSGEPYLYMDVLKDDQGYGFSRARIQVWAEEENDRLAPQFTKPDVEVIRISAGEDGRGIPAFLGMAFYENGAEFADINGEPFHIAAEDILPRPDLGGIPENQRPLMNPRAFRWQCHLAQLVGQDNALVRDLEGLFMTQLGNALLSGKVLLPLLIEGTGEAGTQVSVPAWKGRDGREYVRVFTDWRRLRKGMDPEKDWSAKTETLDSLIRSYDLALNNSSFRNFGIYIGENLYQIFSGRQ